LGFYFKKDINKYKGKLIGIPTVRMLLFINNKNKSINISDLSYNRLYAILTPPPQIGVDGWNIKRFITLEVYYKYIRNARAELSPLYIILILIAFNPIVVSLPLFNNKSLFKTKKLVKCLFKPYLFTT